MAFLSLTKKAAAALGININNAVAHEYKLFDLEDWVVDIIWTNKKKNPGILFYNRSTGFVIALNPAEYTLDYCLEIVRQHLARLLKEHGMDDKMAYFIDVFSVIHICKNNDRSAVGYMTQSKFLVDCWLDAEYAQRVDNSYDLMKKINEDYRNIKGRYQHTRIIDFLKAVSQINDAYGITVLQTANCEKSVLH